MSDIEIASVTQRGTTEPFNFQVARGQIAWHRAITVFGYNPDVDQSELVIWPDGSSVGVQHPAATLKVSSSSADDAAAGTGARTVLIEGLDDDHNEISETVTLNGQTEVATTKSYTHINSMTVVTVGSGGVNAGVVYVGSGTVTAGVPAVIFNLINTGYNNSTTAAYTIPAGYTGYVVNGGLGAGQASGSTGVTGKLVVIDTNQIMRVVAVAAMNNGFSRYEFKLPIAVPEMHTIEARAIGAANNNLVSAFFQIILVKNTG
jgi:hypothetical protein